MLRDTRKYIKSIVDLLDMVPDVLANRLGWEDRAHYMYEHVRNLVAEIDNDPRVVDRQTAVQRLRALGLDDFAYLMWSMPNPQFPRLSELLPSMADAETQRHWTGRAGVALLKPSVSFVRVIAYNYARLTGTALGSSANILDYGCGYGRIARVISYFVNDANFVGIDPWDKSIELCRKAGFGENIVQSEYRPSSLPVGNRKFELIYAYSVFTHLSEQTASLALAAMRRHISETGVLAITVRPVEYWAIARYISSVDAKRLRSIHLSSGFAFYAHPSTHEHNAIAKEDVYGDSSISFEWFAEHAKDWDLRLVDRTLNDRLQTYLFLTPRKFG